MMNGKILCFLVMLCIVLSASVSVGADWSNVDMNDLVAFLKFDDDYSDSAGSYDGNPVFGYPTFAYGYTDNCLNMSDSTTLDPWGLFLDGSEALLEAEDELTVSLFFRTDASNVASWACFLSKFGEWDGEGWGLRMFNSAPDNVCFTTRTGDASYYYAYTTGVDISDGQWHMITGVYASNVVLGTTNSITRIYVDGVRLGNGWGQTGNITSSQNLPICVGLRYDGYELLNPAPGYYDNVMLYDRAMTDAEVMALYLNTPPNITVVSPLEDSSGTDPELESLKWLGGPIDANYHVYFSDDINDVDVNIPDPNFFIGGGIYGTLIKEVALPNSIKPLAELTDYYWRINAVDDSNDTIVQTYGPIKFTVAGLVAHLEANSVVVSGGKVSEMTDLTGRGNNAVMPTAVYQPSLIANDADANNHPAVDFAKTTEYGRLIIPGSNDFAANNFTSFVVYKPATVGVYDKPKSGVLLNSRYNVQSRSVYPWGLSFAFENQFSRISASRMTLSGDPVAERASSFEGCYGWNLAVSMFDPKYVVDGIVDLYLNPFTSKNPTLADALVGGGLSSDSYLAEFAGQQHLGTGIGMGFYASSSEAFDPVYPYDTCWRDYGEDFADADDFAFGGRIAEIRIYNRGMSQSEMAAIAQELKDKYNYGEGNPPGESAIMQSTGANMGDLSEIADKWLDTY
ncbi:MAG: LamG domain-containing protein [Dehalococcoidia bacterium]|nr:LamG domain-containing protein [Dehalococcoidia bacterium]